MAQQNTVALIQNLPSQSIVGTAETALLVPAQGLYAGYPSPALAAGAGFALGIKDIAGGEIDGHPFAVRLAGRVTTAGAINFTAKLYQVPGAIFAAGTQGTVGNDNVTVALAATSVATATVNFVVEAQYLWDSVTGVLGGFVTAAQINGVNIAANAGTVATLVATTKITGLGVGDLNFMPSFTFGTAGANSVQVTEFGIDRA